MKLHFIFASGLLAAAGDAVLNRWAARPAWSALTLSLVLYTGSALLFGLLLRSQIYSLTVAAVLTLLLHSVLVAGYDALVLHRVPAALEGAGLALALIAIVLLELGRASV